VVKGLHRKLVFVTNLLFVDSINEDYSGGQGNEVQSLYVRMVDNAFL
jgi:hypothetical protein